MNIIFMGTPDFAQESLKCLIDAGHKILAVVTNPDKPQGRGMKLVPSPVKQYAQEIGLTVYQPEKVRNNEELLKQIKDLEPDVICVVAYGKILPQELLDIPKYGCINVHGSLLPKYRGAAPIQWAVLNGDKTTGVTTMYMDAGMDTGDIILKEEISIGEETTTGELWDTLSKIGGNLLVKTLELIKKGNAPREKQGEDFTMAPMLKKEMAQIHWEEKSAKEIHNLVRGLNPIMGAYTFIEGKKLKIWKTKSLSNQEFLTIYDEMREYDYKLKQIVSGTVLLADEKQGFYVKANGGILEILEMQAENSKRMQVSDFLRGNRIQAGTILES